MKQVHALLGQKITWTVPQPPTHELVDHCWMTTHQPDIVRTGVVWSHGPVENTAWVIPDERQDGEGAAVCVLISRSGKHTQRDPDRTRSTADTQQRGLAQMRIGGRLPSLLARGDDGYGSMPYSLPRGDGENPIDRYVHSGHTFGDFLVGKVKARGTCPACGKSAPVKRVSQYALNRRGEKRGLLNIAPAIAPHRSAGTDCTGAGRPPRETTCAPSPLLSDWVREHGEESVA